MPEGLAGEDVGEMHLDHRQADGADGVVEGDRGVAVGAGIEHDAARRAGRLLDPVDQHALVVALAEIDGKAEPLARVARNRPAMSARPLPP